MRFLEGFEVSVKTWSLPESIERVEENVSSVRSLEGFEVKTWSHPESIESLSSVRLLEDLKLRFQNRPGRVPNPSKASRAVGSAGSASLSLRFQKQTWSRPESIERFSSSFLFQESSRLRV